ncbi:MAG: cheW-like domain protein [Gemmatimonadetes bacterium]|jgi:chemotaxis-related protein WspD|nr:cheW-like domain protein [Gemmatimonadota bacterium]
MSAWLDLPLDADTLDAATAHYAAVRDDRRRATSSILVFRLGAEWLGLPTSSFDRVGEPRPVHSLPHRGGALAAGLVPVGGDLVIHLSLASLLGIAAAPTVAAADRAGIAMARLVVLADAAGRVAFTADEVLGVHEFDVAQLRPLPSTLARSLVSYTSALVQVGAHPVGVLDGPRVMTAVSAALA